MDKETPKWNIDELKARTQGVATNMNIKTNGIAPSRLYMIAKHMGKAAVIKHHTPRRITSGNESEYARTARKIKLDCDAIVDAIFFIKDPLNESKPLYWGTYYVIFKSIETQEFFLLEMPKFHNQNTELGFEFHYDRKLMRRLEVGERFNKGDVFGQSARISKQGEWCPGIEAKVAPMSDTMCEEDSIKISDTFAKKVGITFNWVSEFEWFENEYVMLNLYGTIDNPQPFPLPGQKIREDRIVMGFRRRNTNNALVSLTKKRLMQPDDIYDILIYAPANSVVANITVETDRYKNQANNKKAHKRTQPMTRHLEMYESATNRFDNDIIRWYEAKKAEYGNRALVPLGRSLWNLILSIYGDRSVDNVNSAGAYVKVKRKFKNILLKDWRIRIDLKQDVDAKVRFKMTGVHGNKSTVGEIVPEERMPIDDYGIRAEIVAANFPDFRRQIVTSLIEMDTNFINLRIYPKIKAMILDGKYEEAFKECMYFYNTVDPVFASIVERKTPQERIDFLNHITTSEYEFSVCFISGNGYSCGDIAAAIDKNYPDIQPTPVTYITSYGEKIRTKNPIPITSAYYLMLDKFGNDISSNSTSKVNIFGLPTALSKEERNRNFYRAHSTRVVGATEGRLIINQMGGAMATKMLVLGNSPEMTEVAVRRMIEADNPFRIPELVYSGEEKKNYSLMLVDSMLGDFGLKLSKNKKIK